MDAHAHSMPELFAQLGLDHDEASIQAFIQGNAPLPAHVKLPDAAFWSPAQSSFLRDAWKQDADWAELIDQLDVCLRE
ncbi:MAG: DUF2789 domain-containing protein [Candidatus Dactylopiibacterium sp.]|nr:DUF2789 domain-containing protein [Candidatus Dactylopiibacterium sp.]